MSGLALFMMLSFGIGLAASAGVEVVESKCGPKPELPPADAPLEEKIQRDREMLEWIRCRISELGGRVPCSAVSDADALLDDILAEFVIVVPPIPRLDPPSKDADDLLDQMVACAAVAEEIYGSGGSPSLVDRFVAWQHLDWIDRHLPLLTHQLGCHDLDPAKPGRQ